MTELGHGTHCIRAGGFGIVGTLAGVIGAYRLSLKVAERQFMHLREIAKLDAWHVAAHEFVAAFSADLATLEAGVSSGFDVQRFFREAFDRQSHAVAAFTHFVHDHQKAAFNRAWKRHCYGVSSRGEALSPEDEELAMAHSTLLFLHYSHESNLADRQLPRLLGIKAIQHLLSYAKST
jgi:hypothetical protein